MFVRGEEGGRNMKTDGGVRRLHGKREKEVGKCGAEVNREVRVRIYLSILAYKVHTAGKPHLKSHETEPSPMF